MFNVFVLSFKTFISSVYSVTGIAMPLSILGISWSFISSIYSICMHVCYVCYVCMYVMLCYVCMYVCVYIYIYIYIYTVYINKTSIGSGTV